MGLFDKFKGKKPIEKIKSHGSIKSYEREFKVAGVRLSNDDNTARQDILKAIKEKNRPFNKKKLNLMLKEYDDNGEFAIAITVNKRRIGDVAKKDLHFFQINRERMVEVKDVHVMGDDRLYQAKIVIKLKGKQKHKNKN